MQSNVAKNLDTEISKEDQANINNFSKINQQFCEKKRQLNACKEQLNQFEDCQTELDLNEDDLVRVKFGDCFFNIQTESSKEYVEKRCAQTKEQMLALQDNLYDLEKKMKKLKATLYAKFGNSINLEEE